MTKVADYVFRIGGEGGEGVISTGELHVRRDDHEELLAIRNGAWGYQKLIDEAEKLEALLLAISRDGVSDAPGSEGSRDRG